MILFFPFFYLTQKEEALAVSEIYGSLMWLQGFPGGSVVKNPPANAGDKVQSLDQDDPLEKEMAIHSSIVAWEISWTEQTGGLQSMESKRVRHELGTKQTIWLQP